MRTPEIEIIGREALVDDYAHRPDYTDAVLRLIAEVDSDYPHGVYRVDASGEQSLVFLSGAEPQEGPSPEGILHTAIKVARPATYGAILPAPSSTLHNEARIQDEAQTLHRLDDAAREAPFSEMLQGISVPEVLIDPEDLGNVPGISNLGYLVTTQHVGKKLDIYDANALDGGSKRETISRIMGFVAASTLVFVSELQGVYLGESTYSVAALSARNVGVAKYEVLDRLVGDTSTEDLLRGGESKVFDAARKMLVKQVCGDIGKSALVWGDQDMRLENLLFSEVDGLMAPTIKLDNQQGPSDLNFVLRFLPDFGPDAIDIAHHALKTFADTWSDGRSLLAGFNSDAIRLWHKVQWTGTMVGVFCSGYNPGLRKYFEHFGIAWPDLDTDNLWDEYFTYTGSKLRTCGRVLRSYR